MKTTVLRYGLYAALFEFAFFLIARLFISITNANFDIQEVTGYLGILVCLSFVYFGIRYYRDHVNGGAISFLQALKLGLLIMLIPAVCFGLTDTLYIVLFDPHFYEKYSAQMIADLRKNVPAAQFAARLKEMKAQQEMYTGPVANFIIMFLTVASLGVIVALLSAIILQRRQPETAVA